MVSGYVQNNTPPNPGISVSVTGGSVASGGGDFAACISNAQVLVLDTASIAPGGNWGGHWEADLAMPTNAINGCMGDAIPYNVTVNVSTP